MIHASLFSGIGGPEVAAKMMGWENAFHCEINPFGKAVLDYWFPESKSYEDITKTSFKEWRGRIDVLTGGFPCQPFSLAGKRGGAGDNRYLWPEMLRVIDEVRPAWVVGENVAGITSMVEGGVCADLGSEASLFAEGDGLHRYELDRTFTIERICRDLEHLGYSVQSVLIPAAAVGAPHRRDRVFIIAHDDVGDTDLGSSGRQSGEDGRAQEEERLPERDNLLQFGDSSEVRSEGAGSYTDSVCDGLKELGISKLYRGGDFSTRDYAERETQGSTTDPQCRGGRTLPAPVHTGVADGDEPLRYGSCGDVADTDCTGREEPQFPGRAEDQEESGAGVHDRAERFGGNGNPADTVREGLEGEDESGDEEAEERLHIRRTFAGYDCEGLRPEHRWAEFPTVPPIHRGNDGIPIRLDNLSISFSKWRTESLKAYGNAILPQVMYRIFQCIEEAERQYKSI